MKEKNLFVSKSVAQTRKFARKIYEKLNPSQKATVISLSGDLGSGKTTFVKNLAEFFGLNPNEVTSPTFVIEKIFHLDEEQKFRHLIHVDAYRLNSHKELQNLGWEEVVSDPSNLICIEWPERVSKIIPDDTMRIEFQFIDDKTRKMFFKEVKEK